MLQFWIQYIIKIRRVEHEHLHEYKYVQLFFTHTHTHRHIKHWCSLYNNDLVRRRIGNCDPARCWTIARWDTPAGDGEAHKKKWEWLRTIIYYRLPKCATIILPFLFLFFLQSNWINANSHAHAIHRAVDENPLIKAEMENKLKITLYRVFFINKCLVNFLFRWNDNRAPSLSCISNVPYIFINELLNVSVNYSITYNLTLSRYSFFISTYSHVRAHARTHAHTHGTFVSLKRRYNLERWKEFLKSGLTKKNSDKVNASPERFRLLVTLLPSSGSGITMKYRRGTKDYQSDLAMEFYWWTVLLRNKFFNKKNARKQ